MTSPPKSNTGATITALKAVRANVIEARGEAGWKIKLRRTVMGAVFVALGGYLSWQGVVLLLADKDVGKWLIVGGVCVVLIGAHIWSGELVNGALKVIPALLADAIRGIVGAFKGSPPPAGPPSPPTPGEP